MRKIICRGWSTDLKRWVYGAYIEHCTCSACFKEEDKPEYHVPMIVFDEISDWGLPNNIKVTSVAQGSVGEFTGVILKGTNKEIYEGDIVSYGDHTGVSKGVVVFGIYTNEWGRPYSGFHIRWFKRSERDNFTSSLKYYASKKKNDDDCFEIIGNAYQDPGLLREMEADDGEAEE